MNDTELILWFEQESQKGPYIVIPEEIFQQITPQQGELISRKFAGNTLIRLPDYEIRFFEWLKIVDRNIWDDLWSGSDEEPYIVGISFLASLLKKNGRGFPICDLMNNDNYYFSPAHMVEQESKDFIISSQERLFNNEELTIPQLLALEIYNEAIDIWHFAYLHKISLDEAKNAVKELVEDNVLVHLKTAELLANFIE